MVPGILAISGNDGGRITCLPLNIVKKEKKKSGTSRADQCHPDQKKYSVLSSEKLHSFLDQLGLFIFQHRIVFLFSRILYGNSGLWEGHISYCMGFICDIPFVALLGLGIADFHLQRYTAAGNVGCPFHHDDFPSYERGYSHPYRQHLPWLGTSWSPTSNPSYLFHRSHADA